MTGPKVCRDCRFYRPNRMGDNWCANDAALVGVDLVSGIAKRLSLEKMRETRCGQEGKYFAPRLPPAPVEVKRKWWQW